MNSPRIRGLFDKFMENVHKIVLVHLNIIVFSHDAGQYVYDRYCKFQLNNTSKKVTNILLTYGSKHCRALNEK